MTQQSRSRSTQAGWLSTTLNTVAYQSAVDIEGGSLWRMVMLYPSRCLTSLEQD